MKEEEIKDINTNYPFIGLVLGMIRKGDKITSESPYFKDYLLARQRGFVERTGEKKDTIVVSKRGEEFIKRK